MNALAKAVAAGQTFDCSCGRSLAEAKPYFEVLDTGEVELELRCKCKSGWYAYVSLAEFEEGTS